MYFIDVQGTLIDDATRRPIPGAVEAIARLNAKGIPYIILTNNTKMPSGDFLAHLNSLGFQVESTHYLDALTMLSRTLPAGTRIAVSGTSAFKELLETSGYRLDDRAPEAVLVSVTSTYDAGEHAALVEHLMRGAHLVGMHETTLYAAGGKRYPGTGAVLRLLAFAASVPYSVVGKPGGAFFDVALEQLRAQAPSATFGDVTMISDDLFGDLAGAKTLGMRTVLVLSGKVRPGDGLTQRLPAQQRPAMVYNDISFLEDDVCRH